MAASLVRFVRGGLGRSLNSETSKLGVLGFARCLLLRDILFPPRCLSVKTEPGLFEAPNVSALTFELANTNLALSRTTGMWSRWR